MRIVFHIIAIQWKPLNVIMDNVVIRLMLSHSKSWPICPNQD